MSQRGQGMIEYSLILVLVSIVVIVILFTMGRQVTNAFTNVARALGLICTQGHCRKPSGPGQSRRHSEFTCFPNDAVRPVR